MTKKYAKAGEEIISLAVGHGACLATDRITVDGEKVGYMYREEAEREMDSGWRFFAGDESDEYANDVANVDVYDVNTIANYDPEIILLLDAPIGSAFIRTEDGLVADPLGPPDFDD